MDGFICSERHGLRYGSGDIRGCFLRSYSCKRWQCVPCGGGSYLGSAQSRACCGKCNSHACKATHDVGGLLFPVGIFRQFSALVKPCR
ncbi:hypothetical protein MBAV_002519 [Candidatus Magnetobacterium bavaricum]|uniref:Uncharacterized protein n=1 Tax=Candidatus Magnetobacterium bavaricum TaxID=29290 RepID=A0A0F3GTP4_9BACT|nr:hypothetical protein MBAV_002519 [Candidatus Magnetobacterium bavaricum]